MRRAMVVVPCALVALSIAGLAWTSRASQNPELAVALPPPAQDPLPIRQVVLFNSGVGYFQREGDVEGDARVDLSFSVTDINDLLKSLVLQDQGGGRIRAISYDSQDPIDKILRSFAIDLDSNPTFGQILNQARGERIEIQLAAKDKAIPGRLAGTIVGMETRAGRDEKHPIDVLNLMTADGLQSVSLDQFLGVRFLNPALESDFQRALKVLAGAHDSSKKTVSLGFNGVGKRGVRVGYVVERPIWKTSYRLRIEPKGKASLQGWALVDNTSDDDWNDVRMVLASGRPISFQMNLYDPLYNPRPMVEPEQFASLRPPVYLGAMDANNFNPFQGGGALGGAGGALGGVLPGAPPTPESQGGAAKRGFSFMPGSSLGGATGAATGGGYLGTQMNPSQLGRVGNPQLLNPYQTAPRNPAILNKLTYEELQNRRQELAAAKEEAKEQGPAVAMNFKEGIESIATAGNVGDYHQYAIDQKITLSRQKSAMLPIIDKTIEVTKTSIYNESVQAKHPLLGLRLKNTSGQPLTQGPITVYDETYGGDTRILDLQPDEERLLSYALDQAVEVKSTVDKSPSPAMTFKIGEASLSAYYKERETRTYLIRNRALAERLVTVEHPIREAAGRSRTQATGVAREDARPLPVRDQGCQPRRRPGWWSRRISRAPTTSRAARSRASSRQPGSRSSRSPKPTRKSSCDCVRCWDCSYRPCVSARRAACSCRTCPMSIGTSRSIMSSARSGRFCQTKRRKASRGRASTGSRCMSRRERPASAIWSRSARTTRIRSRSRASANRSFASILRSRPSAKR